MDVFLKKDPYALMKNALQNHNNDNKAEDMVDIAIGGHYNNPSSLNIGIFYVYTSTKTIELFKRLAQYFRVKKESVFDQGVFSCIMTRPTTKVFGERRPEDTKRDGFYLYAPKQCDKYYEDTILNNYGVKKTDVKFNIYLFAVTDTINSDHYTLVESEEVVSVHVLAGAPLENIFYKKLIAKQIMAWEGADGYYEISSQNKKKYLVYEWTLHGSGAFNYKEPTSVSKQLLVLIGIAIATDRILVLPKIAWFERFMYAWELIDMSSIDDFIEWRPDSFFDNYKTYDAFAGPIELTQVYLGHDTITTRHYGKFPEEKNANIDDHRKNRKEEWYSIPNILHDRDEQGQPGITKIFDILSELDYIKSSSILLLRMDIKSFLGLSMSCFPEQSKKCNYSVKDSSELHKLQQQIMWCNLDFEPLVHSSHLTRVARACRN